MNSNQFILYLIGLGATVDRSRGKGGHVRVRLGDHVTSVPQHGSSKEIGPGC